ncbi:hypothetical protein PAXRUDRAFT_736059 [Paxillus rubicundulus Ve08.2h10]|uniref:Uncharacterized protein n=1 Tax=Paxillus rubicundulus Ve08.2h10 TaxID=930991 RepID=A0A0D0DUK5_9AGAM|nr:hypothetical protein PAXRUDRAFT_736059 [Paxillus rubicundulus Ve08.2h10]
MQGCYFCLRTEMNFRSVSSYIACDVMSWNCDNPACAINSSARYEHFSVAAGCIDNVACVPASRRKEESQANAKHKMIMKGGGICQCLGGDLISFDVTSTIPLVMAPSATLRRISSACCINHGCPSYFGTTGLIPSLRVSGASSCTTLFREAIAAQVQPRAVMLAELRFLLRLSAWSSTSHWR